MSQHHEKLQPTSTRNQIIPEELESQTHIRSHREYPPQPADGKSTTNSMHDDESFEKYLMGNPDVHGKNHADKSSTAGRHPEVQHNHHVRGQEKSKAREAALEEVRFYKT